MPKGRLLLWIQSNAVEQRLTSALMQWKSSQKSTAERVINLRREMSDLRNLLASRKKINAIMQSTARDAFSTKAILNEQASIDGLKAQILNIESQILVLNQEKMNEYLTFQNILSDVVDKELIFTKPLYLYQVIPNESEEVTVGDNVSKVSTDQVGSPSLVPAFVDNTDKGSVAAGMSALVTPAGFNRTKFGGIQGQVVSVSPVPSRIDGMEARVGIKSITRSIEAEWLRQHC